MSRREHKATREFRKALDQAARLEAKLCELSLGNYLRQMWPVLEPVTPLVHNWHIDSVAEHLEACTTGQIKRLVINIPPKSLKSTITSVMWPHITTRPRSKRDRKLASRFAWPAARHL